MSRRKMLFGRFVGLCLAVLGVMSAGAVLSGFSANVGTVLILR